MSECPDVAWMDSQGLDADQIALRKFRMLGVTAGKPPGVRVCTNQRNDPGWDQFDSTSVCSESDCTATIQLIVGGHAMTTHSATDNPKTLDACDDAIALLHEFADADCEPDDDVIPGADEAGRNDLKSRITTFLASYEALLHTSDRRGFTLRIHAVGRPA